MATSPQSSIPATPIDRRWLWAVRIAALLGPSILWAGNLIFPGRLPICGGWQRRKFDISSPTDLVAAILLTLPYLYILWRLAGPMYKRGLAMAVTMGAAGSVISFLILIGFSGPSEPFDRRVACCLVVSQLALLTTALATYYSMEREAGDTRTLMRGFVATASYWALFLFGVLLAASNLPTSSWENYGYSPMRSLQTINQTEVTYSSIYSQGFSPTLAALGGPDNAPATPSAAGLLDNHVIPSGHVSGYTLTYTSGPKDANGKIQTYTISARPDAYYQRDGLPSYFTDQTGVIRMTKEDRPATVNDPPLGGC